MEGGTGQTLKQVFKRESAIVVSSTNLMSFLVKSQKRLPVMILLTLARSHLLQYNNWYLLTCLLFSFNFGNECLKEEEEEEGSDLESTTLSVY